MIDRSFFKSTPSHWVKIVALFSLSLSVCAQADGLAQLHEALDRLNGQAPLTGELHVEVWKAHGKGDERTETFGEAAVTLRDEPDGLHLTYSNELLARLEADNQALAEDPEAPTPVINALNEFNVAWLRPLLLSAPELQRSVQDATFVSEEPEHFEGLPARKLTFERDQSSLSEWQRKYLKKFESILTVWVAEGGTPLASHSLVQVSGRAFVVVRFQSTTEETARYAVEGQRLITVRHEYAIEGSGAGESQERKVIKTLRVQQQKSEEKKGEGRS